MKKFFGEFKAFIMRGNVLDMAVGVIIATAFGKITTSLVNDVLMPVIGYIFGGSDATDALNVTLRAAVLDAEGNVVTPASVLGFGTFLSTVIDFIIVAFIIFCIVKAFNKARTAAERKKKEEEQPEEEAAPPEPSKEELLLTEIRDLLSKK
ncbi:MAG: large-conductance mechanosensitive channel protein MscL [Oscillospiraceae bacterium]|jgi:large conductance mechanosensitive channel|nr:large-conductance mechanosensitive channel protein MscL [Oscillospiraceae bacterium]